MLKKYLSFIFICLLLISVTISASLLKVDTISCYKDSNPCDNTTYALLEPLKGSSFFFSDSKSIVTEYHQGLIPFQITAIQKELPNHLHVTVREDKPLYLIFQEQTQSISSGISENGSFVSFDPSEILPIVRVNHLDIIAREGHLVDRVHMTIKTVIQNSPTNTYQLETIEYRSPTEILIHYKNTPPLIITENVPVYALQHIEKVMYTVEEQTIEQPVKEIDLRFRLPVLRTET